MKYQLFDQEQGEQQENAPSGFSIPEKEIQFAQDFMEIGQPADDLRTFLNRLDEEHHSQDQGIEDYKIGGYHPVHIGQVLAQRYVVIQKLGWGHFSTVWLAKDFKYDNYVAVKIMKSAPHYIQAAYDQVQILQKVAKKVSDPQWLKSLKNYEPAKKKYDRDDTHVVHMLNSFLFKGPYGNHFCMVFEILGVNLLQVLKRYDFEGVPLQICKQITRQVLMGLDYLHRICNVIHTDLKPENVLVCLTQKEIKEIVENGQLTKNQLFSERIQIYQECMGIKPAVSQEKVNETGETSQLSIKIQQAREKLQQIDLKLNQQGAHGTHRKNLKKKRKKAQQILDQLQQQLQGLKLSSSKKKQKKTLAQLFGNDGKVRFDRGPKLQVGNFKVKIADLGNACWTHHHFATQIQTRQYRSPQVLLGSSYDTSADLWSLACMTFEMLTSQLLFNPRKDNQYQAFGKNDDHIAQMMQLLGKFPKNFSKRGVKAKRYIDQKGILKRINKLSHFSLKDIIMGKYKLRQQYAQKFAEFLEPMLECVPQKRATARQMLKHPWLTINQRTSNIRLSQQQYLIVFQQIKNNEKEGQICYDSENQQADSEEIAVLRDQDDQFYGYERKGDIKLIDRSFTDLGYIGFGDGIQLSELDTVANWQFG